MRSNDSKKPCGQPAHRDLFRATFKHLAGFLLVALFFLAAPASGQPPETLENDQVAVFFDESLRPAAEQILAVYPDLRLELEKSLGWRMNFRPVVFINRDDRLFQSVVPNRYFVALAIPGRNFILIDYSRVNTRPLSLRIILKHEMCHLLLHHHIRSASLPKWLDEGVAQWSSEGLSELLLENPAGSRYTLSRGYFRLEDLSVSFPAEREALYLAYQESRGVVDYIVRAHGEDGLRKILDNLKSGQEAEEAVFTGLGVTLQNLETDWLEYIRKKNNWFYFLSSNLYEVLFFLAAVLAIFGYIRYLVRKRRSVEEEEPDEESGWA